MSIEHNEISFEELILDNEFTDFKVENNLDTFETALEQLETLFQIQQQIQTSSDISAESMQLLVSSVYRGLGVPKKDTEYVLEAFKSNNKEVAMEGISDIVGKMTLKIQTLVNGTFGFLENTWNKNIRGFRFVKKRISQLDEVVRSMGSSSNEAQITNSISNSFRVPYNKNTLKPEDVLHILQNHSKVADALFSARDSIVKISESDIKAMTYVIAKAKAEDKQTKVKSEIDSAINNLMKLMNVSKTGLNIDLAEGKSIEVELDEAHMKTYSFSKGSINVKIVDGKNASEPGLMKTANKSDATKILKELNNLVTLMENRTDTLFHTADYLMSTIKGTLVHIGAWVAGMVSAAIGFGFGLALGWIISIYAFYYALICAIIAFVKLFSTKFTNITYRAMDAGVEYINRSVRFA
jgi:hypothetical protein